MQQDLRDIGALAGRQSLARLEKISNDMNTLLGMVVADPEQLTGAVRGTLKQSTEILATLAQEQLRAEAMQEDRPSTSAAAYPLEEMELSGADESMELAGPVGQPAEQEAAGDDDFDAEIMEIFVEDAREMLQIINKMLPQWRAAPENRDALVEVRRAFKDGKLRFWSELLDGGSAPWVNLQAAVLSPIAWAVRWVSIISPRTPVFEVAVGCQSDS